MLRIHPHDMKITDRYALQRWKETTDPETRRSNLHINVLASEMGVCRTTVLHMTKRLEAQGLIKKHHAQGRGGADIEVLSPE
jgi:DNA-binding MarR family transcriptional regulator